MTAIATWFPSYNKVDDGKLIANWSEMLAMLESHKVLKTTVDQYKYLNMESPRECLQMKFTSGGYDGGECPARPHPRTGVPTPSRAKGVPRPSTYGVIAIDADGTRAENGKQLGVGNDFDKMLQDLLGEYTYYAHNTISSTDSVKKRRIVIPVSEPVSADTREAFVRYFASEIGMNLIDPATAHPKQLMTLPVWLQDGEHYSFYNDTGTMLNPTEWLKTNAMGWESVTNWPVWQSEKMRRQTELTRALGQNQRVKKLVEDKQIEPDAWVPVQAKNRLHDAVNRTFRISQILAGTKKYVQTDSNRWSHTYDNAQNGIKVLNDGLLYSYYGSDPLSVGKDLDAMETIVLLSYGDLNDKENWKKAYSWASNNLQVRQTLKDDVGVTIPSDAESWSAMYDITHEGIAQRCMLYYPHVRCNGRWWRYQDGIYQEVNDPAMLPDCMTMIRICRALDPGNEDIINMLGNNSSARHIMEQWKGLAEVRGTKFDIFERQPDFIHFTDGVLDLKKWLNGDTDCLLPHSPKYLLTESTGYPYADVVNVPQWAKDEFEKNLSTYLPDEDVRIYIQKALGRCLSTQAVTEDKCCWLVGRGGDGKSTLMSAVAGALGSYYYDMKAQLLYKHRNDNNGEGPAPELAGAANKRLVQFTEFDPSRTLNSEKYKNYTAAGRIRARKLRVDDNSFTAKCCVVIDANGLPGVDRMDDAIMRRTRIIPFPVKLTGDGSIKRKWMDNHDIHCAAMAWLLEGYRLWMQDGGLDANTPDAVWQETHNWFDAFDNPETFFEDYIEITNNEDDFIILSEVQEAYRQQLIGKGCTTYQLNMELQKWLRAHGLGNQRKKDIGNGVRRMCYVGVRLQGQEDGAMYTGGRWSYRKNIGIYKGA